MEREGVEEEGEEEEEEEEEGNFIQGLRRERGGPRARPRYPGVEGGGSGVVVEEVE